MEKCSNTKINPKYHNSFITLSCWLLQICLEILCYQCVDVRHMIQDYTQIVLHKPQFALWHDLEFLVIPDQII